MDIAALKLLLAVARHGSLAATARAEGMDPSAVSRAVAQAEARLGLRLFHRTTRSLAPTPEGARYLAAIEAPLGALDAAREAARGDGRAVEGRVRVAASVAYGTEVLAPRLGALLDRHPALEVDLDLEDAPRDPVRGRADLSVRLAPGPRGDVASQRLAEVAYRVVAALGTAPLDHPRALAGRACLVHDLPGLAPLWRLERGRETVEIPVGGPVRMTSPLSLRAAARSGLGVAFLADWLVARDLARGRLVDLLPGWRGALPGGGTAVWLLRPSAGRAPRRVETVAAWISAAARPPSG